MKACRCCPHRVGKGKALLSAGARGKPGRDQRSALRPTGSVRVVEGDQCALCVLLELPAEISAKGGMHAVRCSQCLQPAVLRGLGGYSELGGFVGSVAARLRGSGFVRTGLGSASTATSRNVKRHVGERQGWSVNDEPYIGRGGPQGAFRRIKARTRPATATGRHVGQSHDRHEIIKSEVAAPFRPEMTRRVNCSVDSDDRSCFAGPSEIGASDGDLVEQYAPAASGLGRRREVSKPYRIHQ